MRFPLIALAFFAAASAQSQDDQSNSQAPPIRFGSGEPVLAIKPRPFQIELPNVSDPFAESRPRRQSGFGYAHQPSFGQSFQPVQQNFYPQQQASLFQPQNQYISQRGPSFVPQQQQLQQQYPRYDLRPQPIRPQQQFRYVQFKKPQPSQPHPQLVPSPIQRPVQLPNNNKPLHKTTQVYVDYQEKPIPQPPVKNIEPPLPSRPYPPQPLSPPTPAHRPAPYIQPFEPRPGPITPPARPQPQTPKIIKTTNTIIPQPQPRPQPQPQPYREIPPAPITVIRPPFPPATLQPQPQPRPWPTTQRPYIEPSTEHYQPEPVFTTAAAVRTRPTTPKPQTTTRWIPPATTRRPQPPPTTRPRPPPPPPTTRAPPPPTTTSPRPPSPPPRTTTTPKPKPTTTTTKRTTTPKPTTTTTAAPTTTTEAPQEYEPAPVENVYDETFVGQYYYGRRGEGNDSFPLPSCFYNPSGYVCCNLMLNELMTTSFEETRSKKISNCNVQKIANRLQKHSEKIFSSQFETIVSYEDFSQKIHFRKDLVCKIEIEGRFILAYATPEQVEFDKIIPPVPSVDVVKDSVLLKEEIRQKIRMIDMKAKSKVKRLVISN